MFQRVPGSLPVQSQQMYPSQPSEQSQYHTQASAFPSQQELNNNWTIALYIQGRSTQDETERETKHTKESVHWLDQTSSSNCYTALLEEEIEDQQHKARLEKVPNLPSIYITDVKNISSLMQMLEQTGKQQYKIKTLADNQVDVHPKTS
jgi:hypothetical protein